MLNIHDGEPIYNTKIRFKRISENCFNIFWTGFYSEDKSDSIELQMKACQANEIVTPLCDNNEELKEYYFKRNKVD